jgi:glycosyltransferase involved in cell wall biosynthesis
LRIVTIVPFLNEAAFLPRFLESLAGQVRRPDLMLLVDDGSTDGSGAIADAFAEGHSFARALHRPPRPPRRDRLATADELKAFMWALEQLSDPWDVVAKLDGDLELNRETIAEIERQLVRDPGLGLAGSYLTEDQPSGARARLRIHADHVHGATKFYRRECWEQIRPLPAIMGWDTVDEVKARMHGWRTKSFAVPGGDPIHLRPRASHDGVARGLRRSGSGAYALGDHPLHVLLFSLRHVTGPPGLVGALNYLVGWLSAPLHGMPRADPEVRAHIRTDELRRIRRRAMLALHRTRGVLSTP